MATSSPVAQRFARITLPAEPWPHVPMTVNLFITPRREAGFWCRVGKLSTETFTARPRCEDAEKKKQDATPPRDGTRLPVAAPPGFTPFQALKRYALRTAHTRHTCTAVSTGHTQGFHTDNTHSLSGAPRARHALSTRPEVHIPLRTREPSPRASIDHPPLPWFRFRTGLASFAARCPLCARGDPHGPETRTHALARSRHAHGSLTAASWGWSPRRRRPPPSAPPRAARPRRPLPPRRSARESRRGRRGPRPPARRGPPSRACAR